MVVGKDIGTCISTTFDKTKAFLSKFSDKRPELQMKITKPRYDMLKQTGKWPSRRDTNKIVGLNFIICAAGMSSFSVKIQVELSKLDKMLREDKDC